MTKGDLIMGSMLRAEREAKNYSLSYVADKIGISKMSLSYYENGKRTMSAEMCIDILDVLNCDADKFFSDFIKELKK